MVSQGKKFANGTLSVEQNFKVIVIGDCCVGKTSLVQKFVQGSFRDSYRTTVGVDFTVKVLNSSKGKAVKLQIWDIAGQERFTWMSRAYYKDAKGCVIVFDLTKRSSFDNVVKWKQDVDVKISLPGGQPVPCLLLANKCDLPDRHVTYEEIEMNSNKLGFCGWTETSSKEGLMINDAFRFLVEEILKCESCVSSEEGEPKDSIQLRHRQQDCQSSKCSC